MNGFERFIDTFFNAGVAAACAPQIVQGIGTTLYVAAAVIVSGIAVGLGLAMLRAYGWWASTLVVVIYADVLRALPPLVVIVIFYFALPYAGVPMTAFVATYVALTMVLAAFAEEIFWGGIVAVPKGQTEAARSTGMSRWQALTLVVLPQALRMTIPSLTNRTIGITKNTALGSVVALPEILGQASSAASLALNPTPYTLAAVAYLLIFLPVVIAARSIEARFAWKR